MKRLVNWLESHWVGPAYSGGLLLGLALFFFAAASNTMAGWLYVMSGTILAILLIAAVLPERMLRRLRVARQPMTPVHAGEPLVVELMVTNDGVVAKELLQGTDELPATLGPPQTTVIERIAAGGTHRWVYTQPTHRRGVYSWQQVQLRTAAPLGLFWCRRGRTVQAQAMVYPPVLRLNRCPMLDTMGDTPHVQVEQYARSNQSHEGFTRALRPYRWGDPIRLVHWRTSARYGELRVRELEVLTGGEQIIIGINPDAPWLADDFEQAVVVAATLYDYGDRNGMAIALWTAASGLVHTRQAVLATLAQVQPNEAVVSECPPHLPVIWLTADDPEAQATGPQTGPQTGAWQRVVWPPQRGHRTVSVANTGSDAVADSGPNAQSSGKSRTSSGSVAPGTVAGTVARSTPTATLEIDPGADLLTQLQQDLTA